MAQIETATFAGGCFWCTEAVFRMIKGVEKVTSGYAGGERPSPTYEEVSSGQTGHKEAVQLAFDPQVVSYQELLDVFWKTHDPEQAGGQGADIGSQYQAAIFYHDENQKELAEKSKKGMEKEENKTCKCTGNSRVCIFYPVTTGQCGSFWLFCP